MTGSLDGRRFTAVENEAGEVDAATVFHYHQDELGVWAEYAGGQVVRGFLVGTRTGDELGVRYVHQNARGETATGRCSTRIVELGDGRLRLHETWAWESREGHGTSVVDELPRT